LTGDDQEDNSQKKRSRIEVIDLTGESE
jgi:hypothetical protein